MLMSSQATRYAHLLLKAREDGALMPLLSEGGKIDTDDAYDIAYSAYKLRIAQGEKPVGRAIVFSNKKLRSRYGKTCPIATPVWTTLFDQDLVYACGNISSIRLGNAPQPRIGAEIVMKLADSPAPTADQIGKHIAWIAPGLTLSACPFPDWTFDTADVIAAFGLQFKLVVGAPAPQTARSLAHLSDFLAGAGVSLSTTGTAESCIRAAGWGKDLMCSPLHALQWLQQQLAAQSAFPPLHAGEIIATGSWTDPQAVKPGEFWASAFAQLNLPGQRIGLV
jgi:2-keto-4-pentenoate hydratase